MRDVNDHLGLLVADLGVRRVSIAGFRVARQVRAVFVDREAAKKRKSKRHTNKVEKPGY